MNGKIFVSWNDVDEMVFSLYKQLKDQDIDKVVGISQDNRAPILRYEPGHPDANEEGYVSMPNVNVMEEMVSLMEASRSYEANTAAFNATKNMAQAALDLGRNV